LQKQDNVVVSYGEESYGELEQHLYSALQPAKTDTSDNPTPAAGAAGDAADSGSDSGVDSITVKPQTTVTPTVQPAEVVPLKQPTLPAVIPDALATPLDPNLHPALLARFAPMVHTMHKDLRDVMFPPEIQEEKRKKDRRSRNRKRRELHEAVVQVTQTCSNFNTGDGRFGDVVPEMNDRERVEWTEVVKPTHVIKGFGSGGLGVLPNSPPLTSCSKAWYIGEEALNIPSFSLAPTLPNYPKFSLLYPIRHGQPNMLHYPSLQAVKDDLERIWQYALSKVCPKTNWKSRNIVLVLPDTASHGYIQMAASILLSTFGFQNLSIVSESVATTMATGWSAATVVDIGASTTTVAVVEDGLIVPSTVRTAYYGGDYMNHILAHMLAKLDFPVVFTASLSHWKLLERLKQRNVTAFVPDMELLSGKLWQPGLITHRTISFEVRYPGDKGTLAYKAKVSDEFWIASLAYFYPQGLFQLHRMLGYYHLTPSNLPASVANRLKSVSQELQHTYETRLLKGFLNFTWGSHPRAPKFVPKERPMEIVAQDEIAYGYPAVHDLDRTRQKQQEKQVAETAAHFEKRSVESNPVAKPAEKRTDNPGKLAERATSMLTPQPLDVLIADSLHSLHEHHKRSGAAVAEEHLRRLSESVILTGGGSMIPGLVDVLQWRVSTKLNPHLSLQPDKTGVAPQWVKVQCHFPPREMDSRMVAFKGASVMSRLVEQDMWVNQREFELAGAARCCQLRWSIPW